MKNLRKHYEIFKINRRISALNGVLIREQPSSFNVFGAPSNSSYRETEKEFILRETMNQLKEEKSELQRA